MLSKLVIHLKNIIFFKMIIFASSFLLLSLYLNVSHQDLNHKIESKEKLITKFNFLQKNYRLLEEVAEDNHTTLKKKTLNIKDLKLLLINNFNFNLNKFKEQFSNIAKQHQIRENIDFQLITYPNSSYGSVNYGNIMLNTSVLKLSFAFKELTEFGKVVDEIKEILPFGAKITSADIFFNQPIHQEYFVDNKLDAKNILTAKLEILLTEIFYE